MTPLQHRPQARQSAPGSQYRCWLNRSIRQEISASGPAAQIGSGPVKLFGIACSRFSCMVLQAISEQTTL